MTKEQAIKRKAELEAELKQVEKIIQQPEISKEERFWGLIDGLQLRVDFNKYPNSIFLFDGENCIVEYDTKSNYLWLRYPSIWSVFETEYRLNYQGIRSFIKKEVEEHFRCTGITLFQTCLSSPAQVEEHFRCTGITPGT
jgi:hypothetical protein